MAHKGYRQPGNRQFTDISTIKAIAQKDTGTRLASPKVTERLKSTRVNANTTQHTRTAKGQSFGSQPDGSYITPGSVGPDATDDMTIGQAILQARRLGQI